jgi:hypothetical protein
MADEDNPATVTVRIPADQLAALDRFIVEEASGISRPEGVRRLMVEALQKLGMLGVDSEPREE